MGHLSELHRKYFDRGLRIIGISDEPEGLLQSKVVEERSGSFWIGSDPGGETVAGFIEPGRRGIPHSYIVNASGVVVGEGIPDEATLEKLLGETFDVQLGRELAPQLKSLVRHYEKGSIGSAWSGSERYLADEDRTVAADAEFLRGKCEAYANFLRKLVEEGIAGKSYNVVFDDLKTLRKDFSGMEVSDWPRRRRRSSPPTTPSRTR
ncbi:MAG: hypothetical protein HC813_02855 [Planctomycetes bacterium]|nr:hypothetical protein [Planctomycetota bacterium]